MLLLAMVAFVYLSGGARANLTSPATDSHPSWSPDDKIVFESDREGTMDVFIVEAFGGRPVNLTQHGARDRSSSWSPDGKKIAFESNRTGIGDIYVMVADGSNQRLLFHHPTAVYQPTFSPDGTCIAYMDGGEIWMVNADDGQDAVRLTSKQNHRSAQRPMWSPDGTKVAFHAEHQGKNSSRRVASLLPGLPFPEDTTC